MEAAAVEHNSWLCAAGRTVSHGPTIRIVGSSAWRLETRLRHTTVTSEGTTPTQITVQWPIRGIRLRSLHGRASAASQLQQCSLSAPGVVPVPSAWSPPSQRPAAASTPVCTAGCVATSLGSRLNQQLSASLSSAALSSSHFSALCLSFLSPLLLCRFLDIAVGAASSQLLPAVAKRARCGWAGLR
jgi:hypothetical protein